MKKMLYITSVSCLMILIFFLCFYYKKNNTGNNINRKSENKIVKYILDNLDKYDAEIEVTVYSNKNENKYKINQNCSKVKSYQKILEPLELKDVYISLENDKLIVGNTKLNLEKNFEKYNNILNNSLFLNVFIKEYKSNNSKYYEENGNVVMEVNLDKNSNTYAKVKKLYINKKTKKPEKLEILDNAKNKKVCIIYNYIDIK